MKNKLLYTRLNKVFLFVFSLLFSANVYAQTTGTSDGTYDFGLLGATDSGGTGFKTQGDKHVVSNSFDADGTVMYLPSTQSGTFVIKAEGGSTMKHATVEDITVGMYGSTAPFTINDFTITLKNTAGDQIASHSLSGSYSGLQSTTADVNISSFPFTFSWPSGGYDNVAEISITLSFSTVTSNFEFRSITLSNISATAPASAPTTQASSVGFTGTSSTGTTLGWTRGDGANCAVFMKAASSGTASPVDETTYTANTSFGSGTQIGSTGWYCVYNGSGTSVGVSNLSAGTTYLVHVCEYNEGAGSELYLTSTGTDNPDNVTTKTPGLWAGTSNSDWGTSSNWDDGNVPNSASNVTIPNVANSPVISSGTSAEVNNLTVESGAVLTIQSDASNNGSLIVNGTSSGEVTYNRYVTANKWHLLASPATGQNISDFVTGHSIATNSGNCGIAPYDNSTPGWAHYADDYSGADVFTPGKGYEVMRTANGTLPYTGTINTSDVSIAITTSESPGNKWNLVGNPFTAAINANSNADATNFLDNNIGALDGSYQAVYVWDASADDYITVNNSSSAFYIAPGQAFFVYAIDGGGTVTFKEAAQNGQTGDIFKSSPTGNPAITLYAENESLKKSTQIKYIDNMTTGLDPGYDAGRFSAGDNSFFISTRLVGDQSNQTDLDIQCLPFGDYSNVIPVAVNAASGSEIIFSAETNNLPADVPVILEDRQKGTFTPLHKNGNSYQIVAESKQEGTGRFYVHSQETSTGIDAQHNMPEVNVIPRPKYNSLRITGDLEKGATVSVYDIAGRMLITEKLNSSKINKVDMHAVKNGIYIVEVYSSERRTSKKISWVKYR